MIKRKIKKTVIVVVILILLLIVTGVGSYIYLSSPVDKNSDVIVEVDIEDGMSTRNIAKKLKEMELIRSEILFGLKVKFNTNKTLKASVYRLRKNMSLKEIISILTDGSKYNPNSIRITFNEGMSAKKIAMEIATNTNSTYEDVMAVFDDQEYLNNLIDKYWFLSSDILNSDIYVSLEGYLSPNTYEFENNDVTPKEVIEVMIRQTGRELEEYKGIIEKSGRSVHEILTMASILELEGTNLENRKMIEGVFNNRLNLNMNLGSDVTTYYAEQAEMNADLTVAQFAASNAYNTRSKSMAGKIPVGPICNPSAVSIEASIEPTENDYLFFVADKNGKIYFTKNEKEHNDKVSQLKESGLWIW